MNARTSNYMCKDMGMVHTWQHTECKDTAYSAICQIILTIWQKSFVIS